MPTDYTQPQVDDSMGTSDREQAERRPEWFQALAEALARKQFLQGPAGRMSGPTAPDPHVQLMLRALFPTNAGMLRVFDPKQLTPPPVQNY